MDRKEKYTNAFNGRLVKVLNTMGYEDAEADHLADGGDNVSAFIPSEKIALLNVSRNSVMQDGESDITIKIKSRSLVNEGYTIFSVQQDEFSRGTQDSSMPEERFMAEKVGIKSRAPKQTEAVVEEAATE